MIHMATIVAWAIYCGIISAGLIITAEKQRLIERLQIHAPNRILYRLTLCNFCMGFWISMVMTVIFYTAHDTTVLIFISPFGAAAITRKLI